MELIKEAYKKAQIVIVDDEPAITDALKRLLSKTHQAKYFNDPIAADKYLETHSADVLITDQMMPSIKGTELMHRARQRDPDLCVILLSGLADKQDIVQALNDSGLYAYLNKPLDFEMLLRTIHRGIENRALKQHIIQQNKQLQKANKQLLRDMRMAQTIQESILPAALPDIPGINIEVSYRACELVGGDYYNIFPINEHQYAIFCGDASGHGVPAAMFVVFMADSLRFCTHKTHTPYPPEEVLNRMNEALIAHQTRNQLPDHIYTISCLYGIYNTQTQHLNYALAGYPPPLRRDSQQTISRLQLTGGLPLGSLAETEYTSASIRLTPGDTLLLYSDGILDASTPSGTLFDTENLENYFEQHGGTPGFTANLLQHTHQHHYELVDDITLMQIRTTPT